MKSILRLLPMAALPLLACCSPSGGSGDGKRAFMWIDAEANFARFSSPDSIDFYVDKLSKMGFTDLAVDVRPITGEVLFDTPAAPRMREWQGFERPDFDYLGRFVEQGHARGMRVHATLNCFVAGHNYFDRGLIYSDHPEWASTVYTPDGLKPITLQKEKYSAMVNPLDTSFRAHICRVLTDLARAYPVLDGVVMDRVRYDGIEADFSPLSRAAFESYAGEAVTDFPSDIFTWEAGDDGRHHVRRGRLFRKWVEHRAMVVRDAMSQLRQTVKAANPRLEFGTYTGAWYPSYYEVGANFASSSYDPSADYDWATPQYREAAYMEMLDTYIAGNYYTDITTAEALGTTAGVRNETDSETWTGSWYSVEGSCGHLRQILGGHKFYGGLLVDQLYAEPAKLSRSVEMNLRKSDGLMVFDICHLAARPALWGELEKGMRAGGLVR